MSVANSPFQPYSQAMSSLMLEFERELESLDPEDAEHIVRALREMVQLAKRKGGFKGPEKEESGAASLPVHSMGVFQRGVNPFKLGQLPDEF